MNFTDQHANLGFPPSAALPLILSAEGWSWTRHPHQIRFWIGTDPAGVRWLVKGRGGFNAARERAFSIIAQALDISCQSSTFVRLPHGCPPRASRDMVQEIQSAIVLLDEHPCQPCVGGCPLQNLRQQLVATPRDLDVLRSSDVEHAIDWVRGDMLTWICGRAEPPDRLFTQQHRFVQIDNEQMFCPGHDADLWKSRWLRNERKEIQEDGVAEAVRLCRLILDLSDEVFDDALQLPPNFDQAFSWDLRAEIVLIKPRAAAFILQAGGGRDL